MFRWLTVAYWRDVSRQKREFKATQARVNALPDDYRFVYRRIEKYLWHRAGGDGMEMLTVLTDLTELFESGVANGQTVLELTGEDVAAFADELLASTRTYTGDWHEQLKLLKLRYPTSVAAETATFETPYGHLERPASGDEEPGQSWVDVSGDGRGLAVANDAKAGYDVRGGDIGISAVRSPVWAWHDPRELEEGGDFDYMDQGRQTFTVRLVPHGDQRQLRIASDRDDLPLR